MKKHLLILPVLLAFTNLCFSQIPLLNSSPSETTRVIYLDFDGEVVTGTSWNSSFSVTTINAVASTMSNANIITIWKRVSEDFRPFRVNITTDVAKFNAATPTSRMRVIITGTSSWYGSAGGVAYVNSFSWGGTPGTPCWVFENQLGYSAKNIAEASSHESGHTLSLRHQSTWNGSCVKTNEYNPGLGTGVTGWAPIMGVGYSKNVTIWHNGTSTTTCTTIQNDHNGGSPGITGAAFLSYVVDDYGNNYATAKPITLGTPVVLDSGIISQPSDVDAFKFTLCNSRYVTFQVKPWALDTTNYDGANLDVRFNLYSAASASLALDTPVAKLNTQVGINLTAGSYYFVIDGGRSSNYTDYGSLGKYYVRITSNNVPAINSAFTSNTVICSGQSTIFTDVSTGGPTAWAWTLTGGSPATSAVKNPTVTYNSAGTYSVTLSATNGTVTTCAVTQTVLVTASPTVNITSSSPSICAGSSATLTASGATTYSWSTGANLNPYVVSPSSTITYTVTGFNSSCSGQKTVSLTVNTVPTVSAATSNSMLCVGQSATLTASGATTYSWSSGGSGSSTVVSPTTTATYTVTGTTNGCSGSSSVNVFVNPCTGMEILSYVPGSKLIVYPNPAHSGFTIETPFTENTVEITDAIGKLVYQSKNTSGKTLYVNIESWPKGIYLVKLLPEKERTLVTKIIVE